METQQLTRSSVSLKDFQITGLTWKPDIARFKAEVQDARRLGSGDPLTLAEMECSLDLIEADLAALRALPRQDADVTAQIEEARSIRGELRILIGQMKRYVRD